MPHQFTCAHCGRDFTRRSEWSQGKGHPYQYCSTTCAGLSIRSKPEDFWARLDRSAGPSACWEFRGTRTANYGRLSWRGGRKHAHRLAWELTHGPIPDSLFVCHACDNPACCNPVHLFLGTPKDNADDRDRKGRLAVEKRSGERSGTAKLTAEKVRQIRARYAAGETQHAIAQAYGISRGNVGHIVRRTQWKDA